MPFGSGSCLRVSFTSSPAHVSAPFGAGAPGPVSGQFSPGDQLEEPVTLPGGSCRLSATGIGFLGMLLPPGDSAFVTSGLPATTRRPDPVGVSSFPAPETRPGRVPSVRRGRWCSPSRPHVSGWHPPPPPAASPCTPLPLPSGGACDDDASARVHVLHPSGLLLACASRMRRAALGFSPAASNPAVTGDARQGGDGS